MAADVLQLAQTVGYILAGINVLCATYLGHTRNASHPPGIMDPPAVGTFGSNEVGHAAGEVAGS